MTDSRTVSAQDAADDMRRLLFTAGVVLSVFSIGAAAQSAFVYHVPVAFDPSLVGAPSMMLRTVVNLAACAAALGLCIWTRLPRRPLSAQLLATVVIAVVVAALRHGLQLITGVYIRPTPQMSAVEVLSAAVVVFLAVVLGVMIMRSQANLREQERAAAEQRLRATTALAALAEEELRVRRSVAESLHGGLQGRMVMVGVRLDRVVERWRAGELDDSDRLALDDVRAELATLREREVRQASHLLYPAGVDTSLAYALTRLVRRIPPQIEVEAHLDEAFDEEDLDEGRGEGAGSDGVVVWRVALLRAAEEAISNALLHGGAGRIAVRLIAPIDADGDVVLMVDDDGCGMPDSGGARRGLALSEERLRRLDGSQRLETSPWGGVRMVATVPLRSRQQVSSL